MARSSHSFLESMKHDFRLAGLLTYLCLLLPSRLMIIGSGWRIKVNSIHEDEAHSNGTVQDSHLIPFSSVSSLVWEVSEQDFAKVEKIFEKARLRMWKLKDFSSGEESPFFGALFVSE